jgi:predicted RND superfamily exporter protein
MSPTQRFVALLVAARWPLFGAAVVIAAASYWPSTQVRFDYSVERMFAPDDPLLPPYERLKAQFGGNEIVLAVYVDDRLLTPDGSGLNRLAQVSQKLKKVAGVRDVLSLAEVNSLLEEMERTKNLGGLLELFGNAPAQKWSGPAILNPDNPLAEPYRELFAAYTHSPDGRTAAVVCMLDPTARQRSGGVDPRAQTIADLEAIVRDLPAGLQPGVLAGEPVMVVKGFELLEIDGSRLGTWSTVLLGLTILICFRSLRWLIVPIAVVQWSLVVTKALLVASGLALSMVSSMLTAIVTVVGVATVMHLIVRYRELRTAGRAPHDAYVQTGTELFWPIVGALLTDVAGFGSLWIANVGPVQDFGTMMVVGSLLVFPAIWLLVPTLALAGAKDAPAPPPGWGERQLGSWLARSTGAIAAHRQKLASGFLVVTLLAATGALFLEVESDFTRNFRRDSPLVEAYEFVETRLGGAGVWDVVIPAPAVLDKAYLARVRRLEERLRE